MIPAAQTLKSLLAAYQSRPSPDTLQQVRSRYNQIIYFQSARMCRIKQDYLLMWNFLRRAKAVGGATEACLVECERRFLLEVALQRLCRLIDDTGARTVTVMNTPLLLGLRKALQQALPGVEFVLHREKTPAPDKPAEVYLVEKLDPNGITFRVAHLLISIYDILANLRLTSWPLQIKMESEAIGFAIESPLAADASFSRLMGDYGIRKS
jgi:hypothetical protein